MAIDVGARLRTVRTTFGMSQRELARRAGVTNGLISLIEQNRVSPSISSLTKVLDGVPMTLAEFFALDLTAVPQAFFGADELGGRHCRGLPPTHRRQAASAAASGAALPV